MIGPAEIVLFVLWAAVVWLTVRTAIRRGRRPLLWGMLGAVLGVFALVAVAVLPRQRRDAFLH